MGAGEHQAQTVVGNIGLARRRGLQLLRHHLQAGSGGLATLPAPHRVD